jgi:putative phosphoesterase
VKIQKKENRISIMKILVISDTHGQEQNLKKVLEREGMPDHVIHLGDSEDSGIRMRRTLTCPLHIVAGNCDFFSDLPRVTVVELDGHRILLTHGHYHYVSVGTRDLVEEAKANDCDIVMYGHTHRPFLDQSDPELTVLNPGSLSFPRQEGRRPSYAVMETRADGTVNYQIKYL